MMNINKLSKKELINMCENENINTEKLKKNELIELLLKHIEESTSPEEKLKKNYNENLKKNFKNINFSRNFCKNCGEFGHKNSINTECQIYKFNQHINEVRVKNRYKNMNIFDDFQKLIGDLSDDLSISRYKVYDIIQNLDESIIVNRKVDINDIYNNFNIVCCDECEEKQLMTCDFLLKIWKNTRICNTCWLNMKMKDKNYGIL